MEKYSIEELNNISKEVRKDIVKMVYEAQSGHPGGSLSSVEILVSLYFNIMNINAREPKMQGRDRFVLSKGHCTPALYAVLAKKGYFEKDILNTFRNKESILQGHPDMNKIPGVEMTTGSLGQGLSAANGMALAGKLNNEDYRVYCLVGDGELQEGQIWEAAMSASHYKLDNLCVVVDNNNLQIDGTVSDVMNIYPIDKKFESFGFNVISVNGHEISELIEAFEQAKTVKEKPTVIVAKTIKGKGVSFMEDKADWHGKAPSPEEFKQALNELER